MRRIVTLISLATALAVASAAHGATILQINGGGNGHGIGMSQYGAYGYARHGKSYEFILEHYYRGIALGNADPNQAVKVLLATGQARFSGAAAAPQHKLKPSLSYTVRAVSGRLVLFDPQGKQVGRFNSPLTVTGSGPLELAGHGLYRGAFVFSVVHNTVQTVDAVGLDDYVRAVIAGEMPASWPAAALEAQAVAARTYAITSDVAGTSYELYSDARSQMYGGVAAETSATNAAVAATSGQIVTYHGAPVATYFFASSGGHTENIENVWLGTSPEPWLKGVPDPYDGAGGDPYHRWSERMTLAKATRKLGALVKGRLKGIRVTKRGVSPRVIAAQVVGTHGRTSVTGPQLQSAFGLMSTYMRFTTVSASKVSRGKVPRAAFEHVRSVPWSSGRLSGSVFPAVRGATVALELKTRKGWQTIRHLRVRAGGGYAARVSATGIYRVIYRRVASPTVTIG